MPCSLGWPCGSLGRLSLSETTLGRSSGGDTTPPPTACGRVWLLLCPVPLRSDAAKTHVMEVVRCKFPSPSHGIISRPRRQPHRVLIILKLVVGIVNGLSFAPPRRSAGRTGCRLLGCRRARGRWVKPRAVVGWPRSRPQQSLFSHPAPCTSRRLRSSRPDCCRGRLVLVTQSLFCGDAVQPG